MHSETTYVDILSAFFLILLSALLMYIKGMRNSMKLPTGGACPNAGIKTGHLQWCAACYANIRGRSRYKGHRHYVSPPTPYVPWESYVMKKPTAATKPTSLGPTTMDGDSILKRYPKIVEYLTTDAWEDGSARDPSALSVMLRDGDVLLALNDKDLKQSLYTQAESLTEALKLMEAALAEDKGTWRPWNAGKKKRA